MVEGPDELESERIQQDIERTRQQMSGTIDEIQERLTPSRLLHEATASVREASAGSVRRVLSHAGRTAGRTATQARAASAAAAGYARSHPLPMALALSGVALVLARTLLGRRRNSPSSLNGGSPSTLNGEEFNGWDEGPASGRAPLNGLQPHREFHDWAEPNHAARRITSANTNWLAENSLAVGAALAAAGTVVGLSWANQRPAVAAPVEGTETVRR